MNRRGGGNRTGDDMKESQRSSTCRDAGVCVRCSPPVKLVLSRTTVDCRAWYYFCSSPSTSIFRIPSRDHTVGLTLSATLIDVSLDRMLQYDRTQAKESSEEWRSCCRSLIACKTAPGCSRHLQPLRSRNLDNFS